MRGGLACVVLLSGCGFRPSAGVADAHGASPDGAAPTSDAGAQAASDAPPAPALACPSGAGWFQIADSASWYFASSSTHGWKASETECESLQLAGGSAVHLAVADTMTELGELAMHDTAHDYWIGMFQQAKQSAPDVGWLWITGGPGLASAWNDGEPNDDGLFTTGDENDDEDFGELYTDRAKLNDEGEGNGDRYLCECDGVAVPAATRAKIPN